MAEVKLDFLGNLRRTHSCGELRAGDAGKTVTVMGWVHRRRDLGGVIFVHLRDRDGVTQLVLDESKNGEAHDRAEELSSEFVIAAEGTVMLRSRETVNANIATGEVEVAVSRLWILNESNTPPFPL
jgi:aspartyl-tRNA synthetase